MTPVDIPAVVMGEHSPGGYAGSVVRVGPTDEPPSVGDGHVFELRLTEADEHGVPDRWSSYAWLDEHGVTALRDVCEAWLSSRRSGANGGAGAGVVSVTADISRAHVPESPERPALWGLWHTSPGGWCMAVAFPIDHAAGTVREARVARDEWDDDRYKAEAGDALRVVGALARDALVASGTLVAPAIRAIDATLPGARDELPALAARAERAERERDEAKAKLARLLAVLSGDVRHAYAGACPDAVAPADRDPECPACRVLVEAER